MYRISIFRGTLLLALAVMLLAFGGDLSAQYTLRIGVIDQPDGSMLAGARLAAKHINEAGGIIGADGTAFQLAVVDTSPNHMDIAVANMRQASVIAVIGPQTNQAVARSIGLLQGLDAPVFTPATSDTVLLADTSNRIFRSRAPKSQQLKGLADYLVNTLEVQTIQTIQLDTASTADLITLANALSAFGLRPANLRYEPERLELEQIAAAVAQTSPDALAIYGPPRLAAQAYNLVRGAGYAGNVVYDQAAQPDFVTAIPAGSRSGIISVSTWSYALDDAASRNFTLAHSSAFGSLPDALSASSYDVVRLVADSFGGGALAEALAAVVAFSGVQGELTPASLLPGELSSNVVVTRLNEFGIANVVARYAAQKASSAQTAPVTRATATQVAIPTPLPTATPTGYHLIVQSRYQNVRSGPGLNYDIIGQALQGTQLRVLGATVDYNWLVIDYRGQWGWMAAYLVETFGNPNLVPIVQPPASPTPAPTATPPPPREPDLIVLQAEPPRITLGQATAINVTVRNQGLSPAGNFAIASTFQPGNQYIGVNQGGLGAGQQTTVQLWQTLNGPSGPQSVVIVVDLNQEVYEGAAGEANNSVFAYNYVADRPVLTSGQWTVAPGSFDLDGDSISDFSWTGNDLLAAGSAAMVWMNQFAAFNNVHYDAINVSQANIKSLNADQMSNAIVGLLTADGHRGAMRLTDVVRNGSLTIEYRVYR